MKYLQYMTTEPRIADALDRVLALVVLLGDDMVRSLDAQGLTPARAHLLWEVAERGPSTQRALADALGVTPRNVTGLVDALAASGHVRRDPHPTDRRATLVNLTRTGSRVAASMRRDRDELARSLFGGMSSARLDGFVRGLDEVLGRLRQQLAVGGPGA